MAELIDIDVPLTDPDHDALGRTGYAKRVADIIAASRGEHSAVFAIYGEWGSGKTSFKNFVLASFRKLPEHRRPLVIEFNPWEWEGPRQVAEAFFARMAEELGERAPNGAEVSERLGRYATYFTLGASIAKSAGTVLPLFVPGLGPLATLLEKSLAESGTQAKTAAEAPPKRQSLSDLRKELIESIRKMNRTVVVTIDDVDRLTTDETAILFQLLKSNADFPNVVYLLLCDREVVARNLEKVVAGHGEEYLEKIVQLGLPLPKAYPEQLRGELLTGLFAQLRAAGVEEVIDRNRLTSLYDEHGETFFRTMRDVKRFLASIASLLPAVVRDGIVDVDLVDFIGLEILRMFDSELYEAIYCYRTLVTGRERVPSEEGTFLQRLAGNRPIDSPAIRIFLELFPRFGTRRPVSLNPLAIEYPRSFDRYFLFATPPDQYSAAEEKDVLARRGLSTFVAELETARERGRLQHLLELLGRAKPLEEFEPSVNYLAALGSFADTLSVSDGAEAGDPYRRQIVRLIYACLDQYERRERMGLLVHACQQSDSLWFPVAFESQFDSEKRNWFTDDGRRRLREIAENRLPFARTRLFRHPALGDLFLWWLTSSDADIARSLAEEMLADDTTLLTLLHAFSHPGLVNTGKSRKKIEGLQTFARELSLLVPIQKLLARLETLDYSKLTWNDRELVRSVQADARQVAASEEETKADPDYVDD